MGCCASFEPSVSWGADDEDEDEDEDEDDDDDDMTPRERSDGVPAKGDDARRDQRANVRRTALFPRTRLPRCRGNSPDDEMNLIQQLRSPLNGA